MNPKDIERFMNKITKSNNCWIWNGTKDKDGYGKFKSNGRTYLAHRLSYELFREDIPKELVIDHLCRNRACVNPEHLEAVPMKENIQRGLTGKINHYNSKKTHCKRGHEFSSKKTKLGRRFCPTCHRIRNRIIYLESQKSSKKASELRNND